MSKADKTPSGSSAHFVLQGKGGVGKSLLAAILAQYFVEQGRVIKCYDTDPVNSTLARYELLKAVHLPLMVDGDIDRRKFDVLMEDILTAARTTFVVDNGASTFIPLGHYMAENAVHSLLGNAGVDAVTHCVVTGGQAMQDTLNGLDALARIAPPRSVVVWVNEFFGPVEHGGTRFADMAVLKTHAAKIRGVVTLQRRNADTFGADIVDMVGQYLTFDQAIGSPKVSLMAKQRLKMVKTEVFAQLKEIGL